MTVSRKPQTNHWTYIRKHVKAEATDTMGLALTDLRQFVANADAAGMSDDAFIVVGGLDEHATELGQKWWRIKRIEAQSVIAETRGMPDA